MPASLERDVDLGQLGPHALRDGDAPQPELPVPPLPTDVGEAEEGERLRLPVAPGFAVAGGKASELDEPRLVGVQLQPEPRKSLTKVGEELPCVILILESGGKVVGEADDDDVTMRLPLSPLPDPPVEDVVEVDVGKQGRS
jgi:hypothetical protein